MSSAKTTNGRALPTWMRAVDRRPAGVDADLARVARLERPQLAAAGCRGGGSRARASAGPLDRRDRERGDALAAADEAHALAGRRLDVHASAPTPSARRARRASPSRCGAELRRARASRVASTLHDAPARARRRAPTTSRSSSMRVGVRASASSVSGKCSPMSPSAGGAEQRVDDRVGEHVGVGVAVRGPRSCGISTPPSTSGRPAREAVRVVADARCATLTRSAPSAAARRSKTADLAHAQLAPAARAPRS